MESLKKSPYRALKSYREAPENRRRSKIKFDDIEKSWYPEAGSLQKQVSALEAKIKLWLVLIFCG